MLQAVGRHGRGANRWPGADGAAGVAALGCACEESSGTKFTHVQTSKHCLKELRAELIPSNRVH